MFDRKYSVQMELPLLGLKATTASGAVPGSTVVNGPLVLAQTLITCELSPVPLPNRCAK